MTPESGEDLGHGVYVSPVGNGELVVTSPRLDLGWRVAGDRIPGTAVLWHDRPFEVLARSSAGDGHRWTLRPWEDWGAMRNVVQLDSESVAAKAVRAAADRRGDHNRSATVILLPFLGLAPAKVQKQWQSDWLFPADLATWVSTAVELSVGGFGLIQGLAMAFGGDWFLPPFLRFLVVLGPLMCIEAFVRLALVASDSEPVGSVLGLPFLLFKKSVAAADPTINPEVRLFDDDGGVLEILSPINRADWGRDGRLPYRGSWYALDRVDREGRNWSYRFMRLNVGDTDRRGLNLRPQTGSSFVPSRTSSPPPSILKTTLVTAAVTLGPRADQESWAGHLGVNALWLTIAGAGAELIGGLANLGKDAAAGGALFVVIDLYLVIEGFLRLVSALGGRPMGSVFGWVLRPLYRSFLPSPTK